MVKALLISHAYVTYFNQRKIDALSKYNDLKIFLIVPEFWKDSLRNIKLERNYSKDFTIVPAKVFFNGKIGGYFYLNRLFKILKDEKPDIIHIEEEPWSLVVFQVILYKKLLKLKSKIIVFTWENIIRKYRMIARIIEKFVLSNIDFVIAGSNDAKSVLIAKGVKENKIEVFPQIGVDISDNIGTAPKDCFTIGFIGRLVEEKGIRTLLDAFLRLQACSEQSETKTKLKLLIIGEGTLKDEITNFAKKNSLEDKIITTGVIPHDEVKNYFQYIDVLVLPSITKKEWKEQFGHVIIEAFAYNVSVIGSSSGSIPEVIGEAGLIFNEGDDKDLSIKLQFLINDVELRKKLVLLGKKRVLENFTNEKIVEGTYKLYKK